VKCGDLVRTPPASSDGIFWWHNSVGIIVRPAVPMLKGMKRIPCWHIMIDNRTANLREDHLELINESR